MIGKLTGKVDAVGESFLIIDVNGVGYEVQASSRTLRNLKSGDVVSLTIQLSARLSRWVAGSFVPCAYAIALATPNTTDR